MQTVTSKDGTTIAYDQTGDGPALILVGGALSDRSAAAPLTELLASRFTVIGYDRRGRGDSGDTTPYAVEREIEDIAALIAAAGGSAYVFGMSSGAVLALEATKSGLAVTKLALYEPPVIIDDTRAPVPSDYAAHLAELAAEGRRSNAVEYFLIEAVQLPPDMVEQMRQAPMWPAMEKVAHTLAYDGAIMSEYMSGRPLPAGRWAAVTIPVLVMDGGASPAWARNSVQALVDALPNAERRTLDGQTHAVAPDMLAPILADFFGG